MLLTLLKATWRALVEDNPKPNPETTREFLGIIHKNASLRNRLTEALVALASVESPDYKLSTQPFKSSALVQDAIESLGWIVVDSDVELGSAGAPHEVDAMADADATNFRSSAISSRMQSSMARAASGS